MIFETISSDLDPRRIAIDEAWLVDEVTCVKALLEQVELSDDARQRIDVLARRLVLAVRENADAQCSIDAFMQEYDLSSQEGVVLMCLAEALLRIPDDETADRLIQDKLGAADWARHLWHSSSMFVNASTWGLMLTGRIVRLDDETLRDGHSFLQRLVSKSGEPVVRMAIRQAMRIMGQQFVMGTTIDDAIKRSQEKESSDYRYSFDMLGEAALTRSDAAAYFDAYQNAITRIATTVDYQQPFFARPGISVKLSALHPRYDFLQRHQVLAELVPQLLMLAQQARDAGITLTVDAEEADRLSLSLDIFEAVYRDPLLDGWHGLGLALQAYQKRAPYVIDWLKALASDVGRKLPLRLVKGAYWDSEIKRAQERGLDDYPVYTRKITSDVAYLACAQKILAASDSFYPQFATHNAHTVAAIIELAGDQPFEFQRLHGMGEALYSEVTRRTKDDGGLALPCRVYAPVGDYHSLLPYLVRRLLENGANTSFVNRITDLHAAIEEIVNDPVVKLDALSHKPHPHIPLPRQLFGRQRLNSRGINLHSALSLATLEQQLSAWVNDHAALQWRSAPIINGVMSDDDDSEQCLMVTSPANNQHVVGAVVNATEVMVAEALASAAEASHAWSLTTAETRAELLDKAADLFESEITELIALCVKEAGKGVADAVAEVREAVDFCRYYAAMVRESFATPQLLPGPTGEHNALSLHGRGLFVCISPWNFPLAIFVGQVCAALAAGNSVIAKPAAQTPLIATRAVQLLHAAGVPGAVLQLLTGSGGTIGMQLVNDARTSGVAFTGSTETAQTINRALAQRSGAIVPLIAETGGQNCMIVDSSALPEQVVIDARQSAFNSAGQRCSALRVLFLQEDVADEIIRKLSGAMAELVVGDPLSLATDVGPVIDRAALETLQAHAEWMQREGKLLYATPLPQGLSNGYYFAPHLFEISRLALLQREVFGPILHVIRYSADGLDDVINAINQTHYGLTLGVHSRIEATVRYIQQRVRVGNLYVNRNMIGATVGVQPFGGEGLSGTGPKAGGPHYLQRFATERTLTVNTAAVGGNATLLSLDDEER